jgi:hypothetical protein
MGIPFLRVLHLPDAPAGKTPLNQWGSRTHAKNVRGLSAIEKLASGLPVNQGAGHGEPGALN